MKKLNTPGGMLILSRSAKSSNTNTPMRNTVRGQALIESLLFIPLIAMIVIAIAWFSRIVITRQQLLTAARYGTDLIVYTTLSEEEIRKEIRNYLTHRWIKGRKLDHRKLNDENILITINDFPPASLPVQDILLKPHLLKRILHQALNPLSATSSVVIAYDFDVPAVFRPVAGKKLSVSARSEVLSGTGCRSGDHHKRRR